MSSMCHDKRIYVLVRSPSDRTEEKEHWLVMNRCEVQMVRAWGIIYKIVNVYARKRERCEDTSCLALGNTVESNNSYE